MKLFNYLAAGMMLVLPSVLLAQTTAPVTAVAPVATTYVDNAPHQSKMVNVGRLRLNYLDYGGKGSAIVMIPGLNDTAHIYDDLSPRFTDKHHVYAISRRGCGDSDKATGGDYGTEARVQDITGFLNALKIKKATLIGHSIAGDELTVFAKEHPERVDKLVYLDAAYDRSQGPFAPFANVTPDQAAQFSATRPAALASVEDYRKYWQAFAQGAWNSASEANMWDKIVVNTDGTVTEKCPPQITGQFLIATATLHPDESAVKAPALCLFSTFADLAKLGAPPAVAKTMTDWQSKSETDAATMMHAKVISYPPGTSHYLFIEYADRVAGEIHTFLDGK